MNEVSYHLLEATATHLFFTRGPPGGAQTGGATTSGGAGQQQAAIGGASGNAELDRCSQLAKKIFHYLQNVPQSNEGVNMNEIASKIGIDTADIARAGDELLSGGLIYTTLDDQTWAILEAD
jgi:replication factor A2